MLHHQTIEKIRQLRLDGFRIALEEQMNTGQYEDLSFMDRLTFLVDRELGMRDNRKLQARISKAQFKQSACIENLDFQTSRNLDKSLILTLSSCDYIRNGRNILLGGPTGVGKSYLACALGHQACLNGYEVRYFKNSAFFMEVRMARMHNKFALFQKQIARSSLLILDDFGLNHLEEEDWIALLEVFDDRVNRTSTIIATQIPVQNWHQIIKSNAVADAILDRFIHVAYRIEMTGESMRKVRKNLNE